jgi:hypothetical protein
MSTFSSMNSLVGASRGAVMVELAIVTPLLVILVFGITEIGRALYQENMLTKAVTAGARYLARGPVKDPYGNVVLDDETCAPGPAWSAYETRATDMVIYGVLSPQPGDEPLLPHLDEPGNVTIGYRGPETIDVDVSGTTQTITACVITVSAKAAFDGLFGENIVPLLNLGSFELNASAEERYLGE